MTDEDLELRRRAAAKTEDAGPPPTMGTITFALAPAQIAAFKAIVESYDNLATLRTEDPRRHHLKLYFAPAAAVEVEGLMDSLAPAFSIRRLAQS